MTRPPVRGDDAFDGPRHGRRDPEVGGPDGEADLPDHEPPDDEVDAPYGVDGADEVDEDVEYYDPDREGGFSSDWDDEDGYEYEEVRPQSGRMRRVLILGGAALVLVLVAVGGAAMFVRDTLDPGGPPGEEVLFTVPVGSSVNAVADLLADEGIISDAQIFRWYMRWRGVESFQAGNYILRQNMAAWDVVDALSGEPLPLESVAFTVPEGLTLAEVPGAIAEDIPAFDPAAIEALIAGGTIRPALLDPSITNLEGFLFPDTYQLLAGQGPEAAIQRMAEQFDAVATEIDLVNRAAALGYTPYQIVTIASLIQEEYGIVEEMPMIARVVYNRLDVGEPLGIDATSRYEAVLAGRDRNDIDLESDSPYNTRRQAGLPPTPIAMPGRAALEAALAPADGPWFYYVRDPDESRTPPGGHFFTDSAREFNQVKEQCEAAGLGCG